MIKKLFKAVAGGIRGASSGWSNAWRNSEAYRIARVDDATRDFDPPARSADSEISESSDRMNRRIRETYLNSPYTRKAVHLLRDLVVGRGLQAFSDPIDSSFGWDFKRRDESELLDSLDYALESDEVFQSWADDPNQCDVGGRLSWFQMLSMCITENAQVGSVLILRSERGRGPIPLQFQLIEKEQIDCYRVKPEFGERVVDGFELDRQGRELGVWLFDVHPHDYHNTAVGASWKSQFIPARRYYHIFKPYRPSQSIGAPWVHAMAQPTIDLESYKGSELAAAIKQSLVALAHYLEDPDPAQLGMAVDRVSGRETRRAVSMGRNPKAAVLGINERLEMVESNRPNSNAAPFLDMFTRDLANAIDVSQYSLSGDFSKTNYGGFRGALNLEHLQTVPLQDWLGRSVVLPVRQEVNRWMLANGMLRSMSARQFIREEKRLQRFDVVGPGRFFLDFDKEVEGAISSMRAGLGTLKHWCALQGFHWIKVLRQISLENKIAKVLGVVLDHSKGQGGERSTSTREGESESETTESSDASE